MTRKNTLTTIFLAITAVAVGWELVAVTNDKDDLEPWTFLIADHVPPVITWAAIAVLLSWLPGHFAEAYAQRGKTMTDIPQTPGPSAPKEPLLSVGTITAVIAGAIALAVSFGLNLTEAQSSSILVFVGVLAPLLVALIGRAKVFSPATVRDMVKAAEAEHRS